MAGVEGQGPFLPAALYQVSCRLLGCRMANMQPGSRPYAWPPGGGGGSSVLDANYPLPPTNCWPEAPLGGGGVVGVLGCAESPHPPPGTSPGHIRTGCTLGRPHQPLTESVCLRL